MGLNILVTSWPMPTQKIGSWVNRISEYQRRNNFFDFILSPTGDPNTTYIFCKKRKLNVFQKITGNRSKKTGIDFSRALLKISESKHTLNITVIDDRSLLEAIANIKDRLPEGSKLYYSHHGHGLQAAAANIFNKVDRVFFLTHLGYKKTLESNHQFTPEAFVVGNGVVGDDFKPIPYQKKKSEKEKLGWSGEDVVITWLANSRPVKGLHLFKKIVESIWVRYPDVKVISIGHEIQEDIISTNWLQLGKVNNSLLPKYLQLGDVYFFTSLWHEGFGLSLAEAVKCGNVPITSNLGGIPEVLNEIPYAVFVKSPNIITEWVSAFEHYLKNRRYYNTVQVAFDLSSWQNYEDWENRFQIALQS